MWYNVAMFKYTKEQLWDLYKQLPKDLQRATFSEEIGQKIRNICVKNRIIKDEMILNVTKTVGYVFLGLLSPNKVGETIQREFKIEKGQTDHIAAEVISEIFFPLKETLETLYDIKMENPKIAIKNPVVKKKDSYREAIK